MGLLDGTTQNAYYQGGEKGGYQFTSLEDIINYFMVVYVGEGKTISKVNKTDVAFHAQRAMQELSFDTFKSVKSQEIALPPSNTMVLPHDYVNYTKISWSDSAGIKHPLYPTSNTSNPFKILQEDDGSYDFIPPLTALIDNPDFENPFNGSEWLKGGNNGSDAGDTQGIENGQFEWFHKVQSLNTTYTSRHYALWQEINVEGIETITLSAKLLSSAIGTNKDEGIIRVGFTSLLCQSTGSNASLGQLCQDFDTATDEVFSWDPNRSNPNVSTTNDYYKEKVSINMKDEVYDLQTLNGGRAMISHSDGAGTLSSAQTLTDVDVSEHDKIWIVVTSSAEQHTDGTAATGTNAIDDITITYDAGGLPGDLQTSGESTTWTNYKSATPSENQDSYDDDYYSGAAGERYGIDPQHAQVNGSYYVDNLRGLINFSSNVSGKTVILDYISDSLGTDGEMQVHKFAEEAMYKWIMYAVLSTRANTPEYIVRRYQKEKFAATRTAKLRLSNIKLEELTQILRGKSKWIKH